MPTISGPVLTSSAAVLSAGLTYLLGRRSQQQKAHDGVVEGWESLTRGLSAELGRVQVEAAQLRAANTSLERALDEQAAKYRHELDEQRSKWRSEREVLINALRRNGGGRDGGHDPDIDTDPGTKRRR